MQGLLVCPDCGYELGGLREEAPGSVRCPECSAACDLATAPRLRPWPSAGRVAGRLCGPLLLNVLALVAMLVVMRLMGVPTDGRVRRPLALLFLVLMAALPLTGVVHPVRAAALLVHRHVPRVRASGAFLRVLGAALGVNALVLGLGVAAAWLLDAW